MGITGKEEGPPRSGHKNRTRKSTSGERSGTLEGSTPTARAGRAGGLGRRVKAHTLELENPRFTMPSLSFPVCKLEHLLPEVSVRTAEQARSPAQGGAKEPPTPGCTVAPKRCVQPEAGNVNLYRKKISAEITKLRVSDEIILDELGGLQIQ